LHQAEFINKSTTDVFMKKVLFLFVLCVSLNVNAADILAECNYCDSSYDYENVAKVRASETGKSRNIVIVRNRSTNVEWKFIVISLRAEPGVPSRVNVVESSLTNEEKQLLNKIKQKEFLIEELFNTYQTVPESIATSAYDLVDYSALQNRVANYYLSNQSIQQALGNYVSLLMSAAGELTGIGFIVEVSFSDGSTLAYKIVGLDGKGSLALAVLNAVDSNGNNISMTKAGLTSGTKVFNGSYDAAFVEFNEAVRRLGIPVYSGGGTIGGGGTPFACSMVDRMLKCTTVLH
jgi:hypothetical protein